LSPGAFLFFPSENSEGASFVHLRTSLGIRLVRALRTAIDALNLNHNYDFASADKPEPIGEELS